MDFMSILSKWRVTSVKKHFYRVHKGRSDTELMRRARKLMGGRERFLRAFQFPGEMIKIKQSQRLRIDSSKLFVGALGPPLRQKLAGVDVFLEKPVLVGNAEKIQHRGDQIQMRYQHGLRQIFGEFLVAFMDSCP